jgi:hypothetical protein
MLILFRIRLSKEKKLPKRRVTRPLKLGRAYRRSLTKAAVVPGPAFVLFGLEFGERNKH